MAALSRGGRSAEAAELALGVLVALELAVVVVVFDDDAGEADLDDGRRHLDADAGRDAGAHADAADDATAHAHASADSDAADHADSDEADRRRYRDDRALVDDGLV